MGKHLKNICCVYTAAMIMTVSVFCCCTVKPAHAFSVTQHRPPCHQHHDKADKNSSDCSCCTAKLIQADNVVPVYILPTITFLNDFINPSVLTSKFSKGVLVVLYDTGPPGLVGDVPLYIQQHSLRV